MRVETERRGEWETEKRLVIGKGEIEKDEKQRSVLMAHYVAKSWREHWV